jgi:ferredoxin-NADP reductase
VGVGAVAVAGGGFAEGEIPAGLSAGGVDFEQASSSTPSMTRLFVMAANLSPRSPPFHAREGRPCYNADRMSGPITTRLRARAAVAADVHDLYFEVLTPPKVVFKAGQFVTLPVGTDAAGQSLRRSYSIASMSDRGEELRFLIRDIPGGVATELFLNMPIGTEVPMTGPHGFFVLSAQHPGDVVLGATGTGIAPVLPMLAELQGRTEPGRRLLYWGLRQESDLFIVPEVEALCQATGTRLTIHLSRPSDAWTGLRGRITPAILAELPALQSPTFYLVGNGHMISELKGQLVASGIDRKKHIRTEAFFD